MSLIAQSEHLSGVLRVVGSNPVVSPKRAVRSLFAAQSDYFQSNRIFAKLIL